MELDSTILGNNEESKNKIKAIQEMKQHEHLAPNVKMPFHEELLEERKKGRLAFILGNGINRYNPNDLSWDLLIKSVWTNYFKDASKPASGISLTELYDMISLSAVSNCHSCPDDIGREMQKVQNDVKGRIRAIIKDEVCRKMDYHKWLQERLTEWSVPVLTTNYDTNIEAKLKQFVIPCRLYSKGYSDTYLYNVYYADQEIARESEDEYFKHFSVWHINGRVNHLRSIRIGISDYMNILAKTKELLHDKALLYNVRANQLSWGITTTGERNPDYSFTWLNIFYNSSICINGLALNEDETYLRWLLISRKKYLERVGLKDIKGWYVCNSNDLNDGKRFFLENVGLKIVECDDNRERYEKMFNLKRTDI